jgi:hypothetical protein
MATRTCPRCHRPMVADDARCSYCGRASHPTRSRPAEVLALDGTPLTPGGSGLSSGGPASCPSQQGPELSDSGLTADTGVHGDDPPNDAGDLLRLRHHLAATWAFNLIALAFVVSLLLLAFPNRRPWVDLVPVLAAVAGQYVVLCTRWHQWSRRLIMAGLWPAVMPNHLPVRAWSGMHVFFILGAVASAVAVYAGMWRAKAGGLRSGHDGRGEASRPLVRHPE